MIRNDTVTEAGANRRRYFIRALASSFVDRILKLEKKKLYKKINRKKT